MSKTRRCRFEENKHCDDYKRLTGAHEQPQSTRDVPARPSDKLRSASTPCVSARRFKGLITFRQGRGPPGWKAPNDRPAPCAGGAATKFLAKSENKAGADSKL